MDEDIKKHVVKTGTTTIGIVCKDGVIIAADKRGTFGGDSGVSYIAGEDQEKIKLVTDEIIVTKAGTASDTEKIIKLVRAELKLKELKTKSRPTIKQAANLFSTIAYQSIRSPSMIPSITHFLLAGYDSQGAHLYNIFPDGFLKEVKDYSVSGSGMIHVNPILDSEHTKDISTKEGIELVKKSMNASMGRDPATGGGIDIYLVKQDKIEKISSQKAVISYKDQ